MDPRRGNTEHIRRYVEHGPEDEEVGGTFAQQPYDPLGGVPGEVRAASLKAFLRNPRVKYNADTSSRFKDVLYSSLGDGVTDSELFSDLPLHPANIQDGFLKDVQRETTALWQFRGDAKAAAWSLIDAAFETGDLGPLREFISEEDTTLWRTGYPLKQLQVQYVLLSSDISNTVREIVNTEDWDHYTRYGSSRGPSPGAEKYRKRFKDIVVLLADHYGYDFFTTPGPMQLDHARTIRTIEEEVDREGDTNEVRRLVKEVMREAWQKHEDERGLKAFVFATEQRLPADMQALIVKQLRVSDAEVQSALQYTGGDVKAAARFLREIAN
jgi:NACalpha-BTF3-like transcription factor